MKEPVEVYNARAWTVNDPGAIPVWPVAQVGWTARHAACEDVPVAN
jgi:hypothetical protein